MQKIYAMSDIHGMIRSLRERLSQLNVDEIRNGDARLLFLGDYIDRGYNSFKVLDTLFHLQKDLGENVIVLKGNHDQWFLEFLYGQNPEWLGNLRATAFLSEFLTESELGNVNHLMARMKPDLTHGIVRKAMEERHKDLFLWMKSLPLYYETDHQIYVHAGVDEDAEDLWQVGTSDEMFLEKYPPQTGFFYKDIIAGHVSTSTASGNRELHDVYYDGLSHFYIDGVDSYLPSIRNGEFVIPLLRYTEERGIGNYDRIDQNGQPNLICTKDWNTLCTDHS
ncbi:MAG: metallophosphoesterase [Lachnospiraceae bacterium]|nr:metallophosphoesterase [Lachnospiraceae bacterium]